MKVFELWDKKDMWKWQGDCILVNEIQYPEMYPEFAPGPPDDYPFPEFWNSSVEVFFVCTDQGICRKITGKEMNDYYKFIHGMKDRKQYFRIMKYIKYMEEINENN